MGHYSGQGHYYSKIAMRYISHIKYIPLWVYLVLFGIVTYYTFEIAIYDDMGWYVNSGLNIFLGNGYTNIDGSAILQRGPLFPLMLAC